MLHPDQFEIDEAWIAFKLNEAPVATERDGDFDVVALMDAASCFIVASTLIPLRSAGLSEHEASGLLDEAQSHHQRLPATLFVSGEQPSQLLHEAERRGITVVPVPADQLSVFVGEARAGFRERFSGGRLQ